MRQRELTLQQAREIDALRRRHPGAEMHVHRRPWGVIVEARRGDRVLEIERFDYSGGIAPERHLGLAA